MARSKKAGQHISLCLLVLLVLVSRSTSLAEPSIFPLMPADYFAEPQDLLFDENILEKGSEVGWHWTEFRFTSLIHNGDSIRVRAVFAVPDQANAQNKAPLILATHGIFGFIRAMNSEKKADPRYWSAVTDLVKAGYAVMFFDWEPTFAFQAAGKPLPEHPRFTTYGKLDYSTNDGWWPVSNDFKDSLYYQVVMAGRRALTWAGAQPEVDASRVGVWGASYGGIFSSLLAAVDPRITAAAPTVYTARFGQNEEYYNGLPKHWSEEQALAFRERFDSELLLRKRSLPILYTVSTNDAAFSVLKANECFATLQQPKHLLINANQGHDFWNFGQTVMFFDYALRGRGERPEIGSLQAKLKDSLVTASVKTNGSAVEFYFTPEIPKPEIAADQRTLPQAWTWIKVEGIKQADGSFRAEWNLPADAPEPIQRVHVFASVTMPSKVVECSPIVTLEIKKFSLE